jgi:predicted O-methyltransferase YrrM
MDRDQTERYIERLYASRKGPVLRETPQWSFDEDSGPTVDTAVARLLRFVIVAAQARDILEIGTDIGHSTAAMAKTIQANKGKVTTIEFDSNAARQARVNFEREGVSSLVELLEGDAVEILPRLTGTYDLIFLAVDKGLYASLLDDCVRLLKAGGLLITADTLFPVAFPSEEWKKEREPVEEFNRRLAGHAEMESTMLPVAGGVTIAVKSGPRAA